MQNKKLKMFEKTGKDMKRQKIQIRLEVLTERFVEEIPLAYIPVFEDHPWHQEFECACREIRPYSLGCRTRKDKQCEEFKKGDVILLQGRTNCVRCGMDLTKTLKPVYTEEGVKQEFLSILKEKGFVGFGAVRFGRLVGFCWGHDYPLDYSTQRHSTSTRFEWYEKAIPLLKKLGYDPEKIFYHNECGVSFDHRESGIATELIKLLISRISDNHKFLLFKTINPAMARCYEKALEMKKGSLNPVVLSGLPKRRSIPYIIDLSGARTSQKT